MARAATTPIVSLTRHEDVAIIAMNNGENRLSAALVASLGSALDAAESDASVAGVVLTGSGKFFSNGLDLEGLRAVGAQDARAHIDTVQALLARMLTLPFPIAAAISGHAFAGGALLALACDVRAMRRDRGWICLPEVDLGIVFSPGMIALAQRRLPSRTFHEMLLAGRRYDAQAAADHGVVDCANDPDSLLEGAADLVRDRAGKDRQVLAALKAEMYRDVVEALKSPFAAAA